MSVLLLVRHGQASWGAQDYDVLSELGHEQSGHLGKDLAARGVAPARVWTGGLRRHDETVTAACGAAGWSAPVTTDRRWSEFDHVELLRRYDEVTPQADKPEAYNAFFDAAVARWNGGGHDSDYTESFTAFTERVSGAVLEAADSLGGGETGVVFTSGGAIAWVVASLWSGGVAQWACVNPVLVNTGVTKVVTGRRGLTLVSVNEHPHLDRRTLTYR